ncbi:acyltransferase family protein, partial [Bacteroides cellulosilyticus]|uniref:acyltransferase family protein n=1 Tax=Bacteroides cellulosilyticus TaxID=246787 RepID=UPI0032EB31F9
MQFGLISYESGNRPLLFSIMSFFMTSFYFFSGFLFSSKRSASDFVYNKVRKLLFPYVFWSVISLVKGEPYEDDRDGTFELVYADAYFPDG